VALAGVKCLLMPKLIHLRKQAYLLPILSLEQLLWSFSIPAARFRHPRRPVAAQQLPTVVSPQ
jgi:hypothetical protein